MTEIFPEYYTRFSCIGGTCRDTCCSGWEVIIDDKTAAFYRSFPGAFGDKLRGALYDEDGEHKFRMNPNGDCPFLNCDGLCDIYINAGQEHLSHTCERFPRYINIYGATKEMGLSLSCPTAVELIMSGNAPITFIKHQTDERLTAPNNINAELYRCLTAARQTLYTVLQDRSQPIFKRLALSLEYAQELERRVKRKKYDILPFNAEASVKTLKHSEKLIKYYIEILLKMEPLRADWPKMLKLVNTSAKPIITNDFEYELEHIAVYYIARYFLDAVYDGRCTEPIKAAVLSIITCLHLMPPGADTQTRYEIYRRYSKEVEHCPENIALLNKHFHRDRHYSVRKLAGLCMFMTNRVE